MVVGLIPDITSLSDETLTCGMTSAVGGTSNTHTHKELLVQDCVVSLSMPLYPHLSTGSTPTCLKNVDWDIKYQHKQINIQLCEAHIILI